MVASIFSTIWAKRILHAVVNRKRRLKWTIPTWKHIVGIFGCTYALPLPQWIMSNVYTKAVSIMVDSVIMWT